MVAPWIWSSCTVERPIGFGRPGERVAKIPWVWVSRNGFTSSAGVGHASDRAQARFPPGVYGQALPLQRKVGDAPHPDAAVSKSKPNRKCGCKAIRVNTSVRLCVVILL